MSTTTRPLLLDQVKQELQPPCEHPKCDLTAAWIVYWDTPCGHYPYVLACQSHTQTIRKHDAEGVRWVCRDCSTVGYLRSVVPL